MGACCLQIADRLAAVVRAPARDSGTCDDWQSAPQPPIIDCGSWTRDHEKGIKSMSLDVTEANKALVRRFFTEAMDAGRADLVFELFSPDCRVQYPHQSEPQVGAQAVAAAMTAARARQTSITTTIELLLAENDLVAARVRHDVVFRTDIPSRNGVLKAAGRSVSWLAHVIFRVRDGRIVEEWVQRDEAGILEQLDALPPQGV